MNKWTICS